MESARVNNFLPSLNGLHFTNLQWGHIPDYKLSVPWGIIGIGDASNGLCGGMVFTVMDLFQAGLYPPADTKPPAEGTDAFNYIVARLTNSFDWDDVNQYLSWIQMPDGDYPGGHGLAWHEINEEWWTKIKPDLDQNKLVPLGLVYGSEPPVIGAITGLQDLVGCHQVLAWGYDHDVQGKNVTIYIYDPNTLDDDNVSISLNVGKPSHATPITVSVYQPGFYRGFFRMHYSPHDPNALASGEFVGVTVVSSKGFPNGGWIPRYGPQALAGSYSLLLEGDPAPTALQGLILCFFRATQCLRSQERVLCCFNSDLPFCAWPSTHVPPA